MAARDPETGQFISGSTARFDDIEVVTFSGQAGVQAADLTGATGFAGGNRDAFEGLLLLDYDEIVDRNEELVLLEATHHMTVFANSTETADGNVLASAEVSASPARSDAASGAQFIGTTSVGNQDVVGNADEDDSIDVIGRVLVATGHSPFSDGATGVGGGGSEGRDSYQSNMFPVEYGRFHPRDELFLNGGFIVWNIDDAGVHLTVTGQHVYGVHRGD